MFWLEVKLTANVFDEMGNYWAEIADKNQTQQQIQFLKTSLKPDGYVLDLACGSGRHSIQLSEMGFGMVGLDVSARLLRIAKQRWSGVELVRGYMRFLPFKPQAFSAAISMDTSFGYLPNEKDDAVSLAEVRRTLGRDGVLVVDVFNREELTMKYGSGKRFRVRFLLLPFFLKFPNRLSRWLLFHFFKWKEYPSFFLLQKRMVSQGGERLCDLWVVCSKASGRLVVFEHVARLYGLGVLEGLLEKAGFKVNRVYGGYDGESFSAGSSRLILLASAH